MQGTANRVKSREVTPANEKKNWSYDKKIGACVFFLLNMIQKFRN